VKEETVMLNKIILLVAVATLTALLTPSRVDAYGAAHAGYTHVGPNGVYHTSETVARGPGGTYEAGRTTAYGERGGAYHAGYGGAAVGGAAGGYHYSAGHSGGVAYGGAHYAYVR
jgi:hypothetical protein